MDNTISIKGTREGLTITIGAGELTDLLGDLAQHLETQGAFFRGGRVALRLGDRVVSEGDLRQIDDVLTKHDMILRTVITTNPTTEQASRELGLRLVSDPDSEQGGSTFTSTPPRPRPSHSGHLEGSRGILARRVVRSGQILRHTGHIVIIGDVNVGGEVVAGGDIVVWGGLYGTAHAGAMGDESAVICALDMSPLQLRIGDQIARPEEEERDRQAYPETASVRNDRIVVERWTTGSWRV